MRLPHFVLLAVAVWVFSSCRLSSTQESSPRIGVAAINLSREDTLSFTRNYLDTVCVGDTVLFQTILQGVYNNLLEFHILSSDNERVEFLWGEKADLDLLFTSYQDGSFYLDGRYSELYFPFKYIIRDTVGGLQLSFSVLTDAGDGYNTASLVIYTPAVVCNDGMSSSEDDDSETSDD